MAMTEPELKPHPCAFCKNEGLLIRECNPPSEEYVMYYVMCNIEHCVKQAKKYYTANDAINDWNKRV